MLGLKGVGQGTYQTSVELEEVERILFNLILQIASDGPERFDSLVLERKESLLSCITRFVPEDSERFFPYEDVPKWTQTPSGAACRFIQHSQRFCGWVNGLCTLANNNLGSISDILHKLEGVEMPLDRFVAIFQGIDEERAGQGRQRRGKGKIGEGASGVDVQDKNGVAGAGQSICVSPTPLGVDVGACPMDKSELTGPTTMQVCHGAVTLRGHLMDAPSLHEKSAPDSTQGSKAERMKSASLNVPFEAKKIWSDPGVKAHLSTELVASSDTFEAHAGGVLRDEEDSIMLLNPTGPTRDVMCSAPTGHAIRMSGKNDWGVLDGVDVAQGPTVDPQLDAPTTMPPSDPSAMDTSEDFVASTPSEPLPKPKRGLSEPAALGPNGEGSLEGEGAPNTPLDLGEADGSGHQVSPSPEDMDIQPNRVLSEQLPSVSAGYATTGEGDRESHGGTDVVPGHCFDQQTDGQMDASSFNPFAMETSGDSYTPTSSDPPPNPKPGLSEGAVLKLIPLQALEGEEVRAVASFELGMTGQSGAHTLPSFPGTQLKQVPFEQPSMEAMKRNVPLGQLSTGTSQASGSGSASHNTSPGPGVATAIAAGLGPCAIVPKQNGVGISEQDVDMSSEVNGPPSELKLRDGERRGRSSSPCSRTRFLMAQMVCGLESLKASKEELLSFFPLGNLGNGAAMEVADGPPDMDSGSDFVDANLADGIDPKDSPDKDDPPTGTVIALGKRKRCHQGDSDCEEAPLLGVAGELGAAGGAVEGDQLDNSSMKERPCRTLVGRDVNLLHWTWRRVGLISFLPATRAFGPFLEPRVLEEPVDFANLSELRKAASIDAEALLEGVNEADCLPPYQELLEMDTVVSIGYFTSRCLVNSNIHARILTVTSSFASRK